MVRVLRNLPRTYKVGRFIWYIYITFHFWYYYVVLMYVIFVRMLEFNMVSCEFSSTSIIALLRIIANII